MSTLMKNIVIVAFLAVKVAGHGLIIDPASRNYQGKLKGSEDTPQGLNQFGPCGNEKYNKLKWSAKDTKLITAGSTFPLQWEITANHGAIAGLVAKCVKENETFEPLADYEFGYSKGWVALELAEKPDGFHVIESSGEYFFWGIGHLDSDPACPYHAESPFWKYETGKTSYGVRDHNNVKSKIPRKQNPTIKVHFKLPDKFKCEGGRAVLSGWWATINSCYEGDPSHMLKHTEKCFKKASGKCTSKSEWFWNCADIKTEKGSYQSPTDRKEDFSSGGMRANSGTQGSAKSDTPARIGEGKKSQGASPGEKVGGSTKGSAGKGSKKVGGSTADVEVCVNDRCKQYRKSTARSPLWVVLLFFS